MDGRGEFIYPLRFWDSSESHHRLLEVVLLVSSPKNDATDLADALIEGWQELQSRSSGRVVLRGQLSREPLRDGAEHVATNLVIDSVCEMRR